MRTGPVLGPVADQMRLELMGKRRYDNSPPAARSG
jgi:hypothetical protein